MDSKEKIGLRIAQLRKEKKLSQQNFSYEADLERTFLTHIEKGRKNISVGTLEKTLRALEISFEDFFDTDDYDLDVFIMSDQPTTCHICGTRTSFIEFKWGNYSAQLHECRRKSCSNIFIVVEDDYFNFEYWNDIDRK